MITFPQLQSALAGLIDDAGTVDDSNMTWAGRWKEFADAAEAIVGTSTSANNNVRGYMKRAAVALEAVAGISTDGTSLQKIVTALETLGVVGTGSIGNRLSTAAAAATFAENLFTFPSELDNAAWAKNASSITANAGTAPDGTLTADKFIPSTDNVAGHQVGQGVAVPAPGITITFDVKPDGYSKIALRENSLSGNYAAFNLTTGALIESGVPYGAGSIASTSIRDVGEGFYRISYRCVPGAGAGHFGLWGLPDNYTTGLPENTPWAADGTKGYLVARARAYE